MKDGQRKTLAVGFAALAALGFSACSSNKTDSAQQSSAQPTGEFGGSGHDRRHGGPGQ